MIKTRSTLWALAVVLVAFVATGGGVSLVHLTTLTMIWTMLAVGMNVAMGYGHLLHLGIGAFYGLGAYGAAYLNTHLGLGPVVSLILVPPVAMVVALVLGPALLRTRGLHFAVATLGVGIVFTSILYNWTSVTNGPIGISGITLTGSVWEGVGPLDAPATYLAFAAVVAFACIGFNTWMHGTDAALVLRGLDQDELLVKSLGFDTTRVRVQAFVASSGIGAVAGVVYTFFIRYISPEPFSFFLSSFPVFAIVAIGGPGSVFGPVVGVLLLVTTLDLLEVEPLTKVLIHGVFLLLVIVFLPEGLVPGTARRWRERRARPSTAEATVHEPTPTASGSHR